MKSEDRDQYISYLKMSGQYYEEYDFRIVDLHVLEVDLTWQD